MIDTKTGAIALEAENFVIEPSMTREEYLSSPLAGAPLGGGVEPYSSFFAGAVEIMGHSFNLTLGFHGSDLTGLELTSNGEKFGTSWADWSKEKELERKRFHDSWLAKVLGNDRYPYEYDWGSVRSVYDEKGGFSYVSIKYRT